MAASVAPEFVPSSPHPPTLDTLMPKVPEELFRRRTGYKALESAEKAIDYLESVLLLEYEFAARAARYQLAAKLAGLIERGDLLTEFEGIRDGAIVRGRDAVKVKLRDYSNRPSRSGIPRTATNRDVIDRLPSPPPLPRVETKAAAKKRRKSS